LNIGGVERGVVDVAIYLKKMGYESVVISNGGSYVNVLETHQIKHIHLPIHSKNPFLFLYHRWQLRRILVQLKPDLLLPYSRIPTWLVYGLSQCLNVPFITHCLGIHRMGRWGVKKWYNSVLMRGTHIIANSDFTRDYFLMHYPRCITPITVVPRSVDDAFFNTKDVSPEIIATLRQEWGVKAQQCVILLPARFTSLKGHEVLIRALSLLLLQKRTTFHVVLLGDIATQSKTYKRLLSLVHQLKVQDYLSFIETTLSIKMIYAAVDVVVSSSTEPESFGRTIIESQAMGKLVIASQHGGVLETIEHGVTGFFVEPGSALSLANRLLQLDMMEIGDKRKIRLAAMQKARAYSTARMCEQLLAVYTSTVLKH
jgi:glycosyltransferase involved in cell wall biosynthesis